MLSGLHGARGITDQAITILQKVWKHKHISPCIKTFTWRMIRRALANGVREGRLTDKIKKECLTCNEDETDAHLFFHCPFARAVYGSLHNLLYALLFYP